MEVLDFNNLKGTGLNVLVYGEPGCGKTRFGLSVGEVLSVLYCDTENGLRTASRVPQGWLKNIVPVKFEGYADIDRMYKLLLKNDPEELSKVLGRKIEKPLEALVMDTWTSLNWDIKDKRRQEVGGAAAGKGLSTFRGQFEFKDWGMVTDFNELCIRAFTDLPITFVCTFHEKFYENDKSNIIKGIPSMNGQFAAEVGKYFDVVGHMGVDIQGKYIMDLAAKKRYQGKTRLNLPGTITDPTFKMMWEVM